MPKIYDRTQETSTTAGTGDLTLAGAVAGFRAFAAVLSSGDTLYYTIQGSSSADTQWEIGIGTFTAPSTLTRTTVLASSNGGSLVDLNGTSKQVFLTVPASVATELTDGEDTTLHYHAADRARANHTGTQLAATISDFTSAVVTAGTGTWQPLDADLTTWAGLTPSANAQSLVTAADYAAMRALLDLEAGTDFYSIAAADAAFQPKDATLTALAALTIAASSLTIGTGADAFSQTTFAANTFPARASAGALEAKTITDFGLSLVDDADASAARTTLGLVIGTDVQAYDADLTTWAGITPGTGVATALAVNVGSAGAFITFNGAAGTPSSLTLTNATGLPSFVVANEATDTTCFPLFVTAATGELGPKTNANLAFNSNTGALTLGGTLMCPAATTSIASLNLPHGTAPSSPTNGDVWTKTDGFYAQVNGTTVKASAHGDLVTIFTQSGAAILGRTSGSGVVQELSAASVRTFLDLASLYQPLDATLTAFAALTIAANSLTIGTGADAFSQTSFAANTFPARASSGNLVAKTITDFGLSLVDDADAAAARVTLGAAADNDTESALWLGMF